MDAGELPRRRSRRDAKLSTHIHIVPKLLMNGAVFITSLYNVTEYTGRNFPLALYFTHKNQVMLYYEHESVKCFVTFKIIFLLKCAM
jgi:hypothetical protein